MIEPLDDPEFRALLIRLGIDVKLIEKSWVRHHEIKIVKNVLKVKDNEKR